MVKSGVNKKCFVTGCTSGYKSNKDIEKAHLFKAPTEEDVTKWCKIIARKDRRFSNRDVICSKHFDSNDIIKHTKISGILIPYKRPRLRKGAAPKFFSNPSEIMKSEILNLIKQEIQEVECVFITEERLSPPILEPEDIFIKLFTKEINVGLDHWCAHAVNGTVTQNRMLLFSQMTVINNVPIMNKQVIVNENNDIQYFNGKHRIIEIDLPTIFTTLDNLSRALTHFDEVKLCAGGPKLSAYKDIINVTKCAYIDYDWDVWRHNDCNFVSNTVQTHCSLCHGLWKNFDRNRKNLLRLKSE